MRRLLLVVCWLAAAQTVCARKPAVRFDLPYTLERGKYVVTAETAAGPRRFAFDTGASQTCISERLSRELGLAASGRGTSGDFEGHRHAITYVRVPYLRMGEATYSDRQVIVLPDSSYIFRCLGFDGIAGSDLLRGFVVRMPNADSTITLAGDLRQLGLVSLCLIFQHSDDSFHVPRPDGHRVHDTLFIQRETHHQTIVHHRVMTVRQKLPRVQIHERKITIPVPASQKI